MHTPESLEIQQEIIKAINFGKAILFTGAGFSAGTENLLGEEPPRAAELSKQIAVLAGISEDEDLQFTSEYFLEHNSPKGLVNFLSGKYTIKKVSAYHEEIIKVNWKRIYTTNYDNAIELAAQNQGKFLRSLTIEDDPKEFWKDRNTCIHINGSINDLTEEQFADRFKLSRSSYVTEKTFQESPWHYPFKKDLESCSAIVFVGYSLYDMDIERLLFMQPEFKEKTFFVTRENPSEKTRFKFSKYGKILSTGVSGFGTVLRENLSEIYTEPCDTEFWLDTFEEFYPQEGDNFLKPSQDPSDNEIWDFLLYGKLNKDHFLNSISSQTQKSYLVIRSVVEKVANDLCGGKSVVVYSDFGNGKTVFLEEVSTYLYLQNTRVFHMTDEEGQYIDDIQKIVEISNGENVILVIDSYSKHLQIVDYLLEVNYRNLSLLLADRSYEHERNAADICFKSVKPILEYDLNRLDGPELTSFLSIIDNLGIWKGTLGLSNSEKERILSGENYKSEISSILLDIFNAPQIHGKISKFMESILINPKLKDTVFAICLLEVFNYSPKQSLVSEVAGNDFIYSSDFRGHSDLNQLLKLNGSLVETRSSIFSLNLLKKHFPPAYVTNKLLSIAQHFDDIQHHGEEQKNIFTSLLRFTNIEKLVPDEKKRNSLIKYYDELKVKIPWLRSSSPHYWLQYAMARMTYKDFTKAESYLSQAYSIADTKEAYNVVAIDNQNARLYLLKALDENNASNSFDFFINAHNILSPLPNDVYKFRRVLEYQDIYKKRYPNFSKKNQDSFYHACNQMFSNLSKDNNPKKFYIRESEIRKCYFVLEEIINNIKRNNSSGS
jgi:hypothetical protein